VTTKGAFWGIASGVFFACTVLAFSEAGSISPISQTAIARTVSLGVALALALAGGGIGMPRDLRGRASVAGLLELAGLALLTLAFFLGPLAVAGVATAQLGTFAVILGFTILRERPRRHQWTGIACTLSGVSLLAALA
jgi:drug/metabolite transporter (DMT)-like permease